MVIGFCGPHRCGKTYLASALVDDLKLQGFNAVLVPSPVSATFRRLGVDPSKPMGFDTRLNVQRVIIEAFRDTLEGAIMDKEADIFVLDRTPIDFIGYMLTDFKGKLTPKQIKEVGVYSSICMSLIHDGTFNHMFVMHPHSDLEFAIEEFKGRQDSNHIHDLDTIMTTLAYLSSSHYSIVDIPASTPLQARLDFVQTHLVSKLHDPG